MERIGIITGMLSEARCFADTPVLKNSEVRVAGAISAKAYEDARNLAAQGCSALISFGIAGGRDPRIRAGSLILANEVIAPGGERYSTDEAARSRLHDALDRSIHVSHAPLVGSDRVVMSVQGKTNLHVDTGAAGVDMESHAVAKAAADAGIPFLVIRAVSDTADHPVPKAILGALSPDGRRRPGRVLINLLARPLDLPGLILLQRATATAHRSLRSVAASGGPGLGFR